MLPLPFHEAVDEIYLFAMGYRDERCTVAELHGGGFRSVERWPVGQSLAVGIAGFGKVHPVLLYDFSNSGLGGIFVGLRQEGAVEVEYF